MTVADLHTLQQLDIEGPLSLVKRHRTAFVAEAPNTRGEFPVADATKKSVDAGID
jgi:hypothetical protein